MTLLIAPIKHDLALNDTQVSLLHGFAFLFIYVFMGLPFGRLADRSNRIRIIAFGVTLFSMMTAACGLAKNFWHLAFTRFGVGIGQATLSPAAYSLISDYFPTRLLSRAVSVYFIGGSIGAGAAYLAGGLALKWVKNMSSLELPIIGSIYHWQFVFFVVGLPGLLVAIWVSTVQEPIRRNLLKPDRRGKRSAPISEIIGFLLENRKTILSHFLGMSSVLLAGSAFGLWLPSLFLRSYGWETSDTGMVFGTLYVVFGPIGLILSGWLADKLRQKGHLDADYTVLIGIELLAIIPFSLLSLMPTAMLAWFLVIPSIILRVAPWGIALSAINRITPNEMRGQLSALCLFSINMIGATSGPTLVALCTDYIFRDENALCYSLSIVTGSSALIAFGLFFWGRKSYEASAQRAMKWK